LTGHTDAADQHMARREMSQNTKRNEGVSLSRTTEFVLGLIGGIVAFGGAFFALAFGAVDKAVSGSGTISGLGVAAFVFAALAIVGAIVVKLKPKLGGWLLLLSGVGILISISLFGVLPMLLLVPAGLMGLLRKEPKSASPTVSG